MDIRKSHIFPGVPVSPEEYSHLNKQLFPDLTYYNIYLTSQLPYCKKKIIGMVGRSLFYGFKV